MTFWSIWFVCCSWNNLKTIHLFIECIFHWYPTLSSVKLQKRHYCSILRCRRFRCNQIIMINTIAWNRCCGSLKWNFFADVRVKPVGSKFSVTSVAVVLSVVSVLFIIEITKVVWVSDWKPAVKFHCISWAGVFLPQLMVDLNTLHQF